MKTLVKIFDKDYLKNGISSLILNIECVYVLYHKYNEEAFNAFVKVINKKKPNLKISFYQYDDNIFNEFNTDDIIVDLYGGDDYIQLKVFECCLNNNIQTIMVDIMKKEIIKMHNADNLFLTYQNPKLSIQDLLELTGAEIDNSLHKTPILNNHEYNDSLVKIFDIVVDYGFDKYTEMCSLITKDLISKNLIVGNNKTILSKSVDINLLRSLAIFNEFERKELLQIQNRMIIYKNNEVFDLVRNAGLILEQYLYLKLIESNYFDEVKMSVVIRKDYYNQKTHREIDLIVLKDLKLIFISCKMYAVNIQDVMEIKTHEEYFGNFLSSSALICGQWLEKQNYNLYLRTKELYVYIVDKDEFKCHKAISDIRNIIEGTYQYDL